MFSHGLGQFTECSYMYVATDYYAFLYSSPPLNLYSELEGWVPTPEDGPDLLFPGTGLSKGRRFIFG